MVYQKDHHRTFYSSLYDIPLIYVYKHRFIYLRNSKLFSIHKYKSSNENGEDSDKVKAEAEENWKNLQAKDKSDILDEFHKVYNRI